MTTNSVALARPSRLTIVGIVGFAAAVAAASQIAIPLPFTPVPITLQPMLVILAGMLLGLAEQAAIVDVDEAIFRLFAHRHHVDQAPVKTGGPMRCLLLGEVAIGVATRQ